MSECGKRPRGGGTPSDRRPGLTGTMLGRKPRSQRRDVEFGDLADATADKVVEQLRDVTDVGPHRVRGQPPLGRQVPLEGTQSTPQPVWQFFAACLARRLHPTSVRDQNKPGHHTTPQHGLSAHPAAVP